MKVISPSAELKAMSSDNVMKLIPSKGILLIFGDIFIVNTLQSNDVTTDCLFTHYYYQFTPLPV